MDVIGGKLERALDRASDGQGVRFARADYSNAGGFTPAPYLIADEGVFGPGVPVALSQAALPAPNLRVPNRALTRLPMSQVLGSAFGSDPAAAPAQVRRAYNTLRAMGL
jgi:hypothetical protein